MKKADIVTILQRLENHPSLKHAPVHHMKSNHREDPFRTLVSVLLSSRTQDPVTIQAVQRLMERAPTPEAVAGLPESEIARLIYPVGFYRTKARHLKQLAQMLLDRFEGRVPSSREALMELPGVGRKTANLVLAEAFGKPTIAVDTHVHRIANRLGLVKTRRPEETEQALEAMTPERYRSAINHWFVALGQTLCKPIQPRCDACPLNDLCPRNGVKSTANPSQS